MKPLKFIVWAFTVLTIFHFAGCNIEPVEGKFEEASNPCLEEADLGKMRAKIDTLDFHAEMMEASNSVYYHDNSFYHLNLSVTDPSIGTIFLVIILPEVGIHDLTTPFEAGFPNSNANNHELLTSAAVLSTNGILVNNPDNYVTYSGFGGSGEVEITAVNLVEGTASGNFNFIGKRSKKDPDTGEVILDENGELIIESIEVNCGFFNEARFELGDGGPGEPDYGFFNDFYANVDGEEFIENSVTVELALIDNAIMYNIIATTADGRSLRIDIPANTGTGTFNFEAISDGTLLTAVYHNNNGSEGLTPNPGTITITDFNIVTRILEGTFSFRGSDPLGIDPTVVEVTDGEFKLSIPINSVDRDMVMALVNGEVFGDETNFIDVVVTDFLGVDIVTISAIDDLNRSIGLVFPADIEVGSYLMSSNVVNGSEKVGLYSPDDGNVSSFRSNPGTFTIVNHNLMSREIEGTFEYEAVDIFNQDPTVYSVTNGSFYIIY